MFAVFKEPGDNSKGKTSLDISTFFNFFPVSLFTITKIFRIFFYSLFSIFLLILFWPFAMVFTILNPVVKCQFSSYRTISNIILSQRCFLVFLLDFRLLCLLYFFINSYNLRPLNLRLSRPQYSKISFLHRGWLGNLFLGHALNHQVKNEYLYIIIPSVDFS